MGLWMTESDKTSDILGAAAKLAEAIPVYDDALAPVMKETGKALSTVGRVVNVALAPIKGLVWSAEFIEEWLGTTVAKKLEAVDESEITTPDLGVAGPTIEALKFNGHKAELSEMFANLMASSMQKSKSESAHPSFVGIISSMSSLDAQMFAAVSKRRATPTININVKAYGTEGISPFISYYHPDLSAIVFRYSSSEPNPLARMQASIEQLIRLGLIEGIKDNYLTSEDNSKIYDQLMDGEVVKEIKKRGKEGEISYVASKSFLRTTQMGLDLRYVALD